jgi:hypothetical protein
MAAKEPLIVSLVFRPIVCIVARDACRLFVLVSLLSWRLTRTIQSSRWMTSKLHRLRKGKCASKLQPQPCATLTHTREYSFVATAIWHCLGSIANVFAVGSMFCCCKLSVCVCVRVLLPSSSRLSESMHIHAWQDLSDKERCSYSSVCKRTETTGWVDLTRKACSHACWDMKHLAWLNLSVPESLR